jgi:aryl-alcohol dehydrogenase-like predicted oxidoreductase
MILPTDLFYQHRPDRNVPIEEVMKTLKECVEQGKIRHIGLSEVNGDLLRRAHAVHPVSAIQVRAIARSRS